MSIKRFQNYIEKKPWDEVLLRQEKALNIFTIALSLCALCFFLGGLMWGK